MFKKNQLNFFLALAMFTDLVFLSLIGLIIHYVLPPGSGRHGGPGVGEPATFLLLGRHDWGQAHWVLALVFLVMLVLHLLLHWKWIWNQYKIVFKKSPGINSRVE